MDNVGVKKTKIQLTDDLAQITVTMPNGDQLTFPSGTIHMTKKNRFLIPPHMMHHKYYLVIEDYAWWHDNHYDITDWMCENLPRGEEHQQGMMLTFDTEEQRAWFLLRWS